MFHLPKDFVSIVLEITVHVSIDLVTHWLKAGDVLFVVFTKFIHCKTVKLNEGWWGVTGKDLTPTATPWSMGWRWDDGMWEINLGILDLIRLYFLKEKEALAFTGTPWTLIMQKSLAKDNNKKGRPMFFGKVQGNYNGKSNNKKPKPNLKLLWNC